MPTAEELREVRRGYIDRCAVRSHNRRLNLETAVSRFVALTEQEIQNLSDLTLRAENERVCLRSIVPDLIKKTTASHLDVAPLAVDRMQSTNVSQRLCH